MLTPDSYMKNKSGIYVPICKGKGFCPNPVARDGIPYFADSESNPEVVGTQKYEDYWNEQIERCEKGYETGGIFIPGRYYYYLNFQTLKGLAGVMYPWITDLDLEYFLTVDYIKKHKKTGLIGLKARRKGLSEDYSTIVNHGLRFIDGYRAGIAAGLKDYTEGLQKKLVYAFDNVVPEMRLNYTNSNSDILQTGYYEKTETGSYALRGFGGNVQYATMHDKSEKMEGEYFHDIAFEESGQFDKMLAAFESIKPNLMWGSEMAGTFYIYGTAGNILSSSKGFQFLWQYAETYGLVKMWIPGRRKFYPFMANSYSGECINKATGEIAKSYDQETEKDLNGIKEIDPIKNLRKYKPEERIGMEDVEVAASFIKKEKAKLAKLPDKRALIKFNKSFPETEEEAWSSGGNNNFDPDVLNTQVVELMKNEIQLKQYVLDWVYEKNEFGHIERVYPLKVKPRIATHKDPDYKIHLVFKEPMPEYRDLDIQGVDSYNQDKTIEFKSLGASIILRRYNVLPGYAGQFPGEVPVCMYYKRPKRKEIFYEESLKEAVWYNTLSNSMISAEYDNIIDFWKKNGGKKYLALRPKSFESKKSQQEHKFGAKMTSTSKLLALGIAQTWVLDNAQFIYFPELLRDFLAYDEEQVESDWDSADAMMLALMRIIDMKRFPRNFTKTKKINKSSFPEYFHHDDGSLTVVTPEAPRKIEPSEYQKKGYITSDDLTNSFPETDPFEYLDDFT